MLVSFLGNSVTNTDRQKQADKGRQKTEKRKEKTRKNQERGSWFFITIPQRPPFIHPIIIILIVQEKKEDSPDLLKFPLYSLPLLFF